VLEMKEATNVKELRTNLGCFGYYRKFNSQFSQIAEPLYVLLRKGAKFVWTEKQQNAFDTLKSRLASASVFALPVDDAVTIVDGEERPLAYASRTYSKQEQNYCITRREMLGLIFGLKRSDNTVWVERVWSVLTMLL